MDTDITLYFKIDTLMNTYLCKTSDDKIIADILIECIILPICFSITCTCLCIDICSCLSIYNFLSTVYSVVHSFIYSYIYHAVVSYKESFIYLFCSALFLNSITEHEVSTAQVFGFCYYFIHVCINIMYFIFFSCIFFYPFDLPPPDVPC